MKKVFMIVIAALLMLGAATGTRAQITVEGDSALLWKTLPYQYGVTGEILNAVYSPDETKIIVTTTEKWCELDAETGAFIRMLPDNIRGLAKFTENGDYFISYALQKVRYSDLQVLGQYKMPENNKSWKFKGFDVTDKANVLIAYITHAAHQPTYDTSLFVYDYTTFELKKKTGIVGNYMFDVKISPTGEYFITQSEYDPDLSTTSENRWVCTQWDLKTLEQIKEVPQLIDNELTLIAFSDNGERIGVIRNKDFSIFDGKTFETKNKYVQKSEMRIGIDFSSDGKYVLAGPFWDKEIETLSLQYCEVDNQKVISKYEGDWSNIAGTVTIYLNKDSKRILFVQSSNIKIIKLPTSGVTPKLIQMKAFLHPNPTKGIATLRLENLGVRRIIVEIFDTTGKTIKKDNITLNNSDDIQIDLTRFSIGTYILKCSDAITGQTLTEQNIIKE